MAGPMSLMMKTSFLLLSAVDHELTETHEADEKLSSSSFAVEAVASAAAESWKLINFFISSNFFSDSAV